MRPQLPLLLAALLQLVHTCFMSTLWPLASRALKRDELREHMLSLPVAPTCAASYGYVRLYICSRYLHASVQCAGLAAELVRGRAVRVVLTFYLGG